jgi:ABC-type multidrug transport system permease subunit
MLRRTLMKMRGEDTEAGLREWVKAEIRDGPKQIYDLGKFFFSVSTGTIGAIVAIEKLNQHSAVDCPMLASLLILTTSQLVALDMARPRKYVIGGDTDLLDEYSRQIKSAQVRTWIWFIIWVTGTIFGGMAVRS